ncbi:hypothetical protein JWG44_08670 [Leptospira sp. 201903071]|uniref:hypothetical protein n=1 Tax=Leptospira ainazelensis TaxID=2810034 RepID=UPI001963CBF0|nr:hypothetical protein [Leptospira ainazelensis]MBM9500319.1 hypothetical protein [Leptospira ainazelensis]
MRKFTKIICLTILISQFYVCKEEKSDDISALLLLGIASSANENATKTSTQVRAAVSGLSNSISSSIQGGVATNFNFPIPKMEKNKLVAYVQKKSSIAVLQRGFQSFPTALSKESGTCNATSCSATLNGTVDCKIGGNNSGTATLDKMKVVYSASMGAGGMSFSMNMDGKVKMDKCASQSSDWFNYPSLTTSVSSGDITLTGDSKVEFASMDMATQTATIKYVEKNTTTSPNLAINGGSAQTVNVTQDVNIELNSKPTITEAPTFSNNNFKFKASYVDVVTGTVSVSGSVGGGSVNVSRTYNKDKFTYDVACDIKIDTDNKISGDCSVTVK